MFCDIESKFSFLLENLVELELLISITFHFPDDGEFNLIIFELGPKI